MDRGGEALERQAGKIVFDHRLLVRTLVFAAILCWPLLLIGRPAYFPDSLGYYNGGRAAIIFAARTLDPDKTRAVRTATVRAAETKATRSIQYGVLAYLAGGNNGAMTPLAVVQALLAGFVIAVAVAVAAPPAWIAWGVGVVVAMATPAAWVACLTVPDIFAGLLILAVGLLVTQSDRLSRGIALALAGIALLAIVSHPSHLAIAALMGLFAAFAFARRRASAWVLVAAVPAVVLVGIGGLIGFGQFSLAPKRYPLTLARSVADGPGRWYLTQACESRRYAICEIYGRQMPTTTTDFLWGPGGVMARATPAQLDRIRNEEADIVLRAAAAYPLQQLRASLHGVGRQLVNFRVVESDYNERIVLAADGTASFAADARMPRHLQDAADGLAWVTAVAALIWLGLGLVRASPGRRLAVLIFVGVVGNAAVCAVLSSVSDRYQARVVWLLPLAAMLVPLPACRRPPLARGDIVGQT